MQLLRMYRRWRSEQSFAGMPVGFMCTRTGPEMFVWRLLVVHLNTMLHLSWHGGMLQAQKSTVSNVGPLIGYSPPAEGWDNGNEEPTPCRKRLAISLWEKVLVLGEGKCECKTVIVASLWKDKAFGIHAIWRFREPPLPDERNRQGC